MAQYTKNPPLLESAIDRDPFAQFSGWLRQAKDAGMREPTAMTLATVDANGRPSARVVLLKDIAQGGLCFYTNYESRKGAALAANPYAAATFWWDIFERSVRFEGRVQKLPVAMSDEYFHSRPRGSQLGALCSAQSHSIASRAALEASLAASAATVGEGEVPLPAFWGGYLLVPDRIEFWQGRDNRLHDRLLFTRSTEAESWTLTRLQP